MKPMRLLVIAALLGVGALVYLLMLESSDRGQHDRRAVENSGGSTRTEGERKDKRAGAAVQTRGTGPLSAKLQVEMPDGSAAGGAELTLRGHGEIVQLANADGAIEFAGLHRGLYNVTARNGDAVGALDFELEQTTDLGTLRLAEAVAIRGHVLDSQGAAIVGATVDATRGAEQQSFNMTAMVQILMSPEPVVARTLSGEDGAYELLVPKAGDYALRAAAEGFAQEAEAPRTFAATVEGVDFYLLPGIQVAGRVTEASGSPIEGAAIMLVDPMSAFGQRLPKSETTTAFDGSFSIATTPKRQLLLVVRASGFATHMDSNLVLPAVDLQITLEPGVTVRLTAVDKAQTAIPAPGVSVAVMYRGGFAAGETDESGELVVENLPTKGSRMWGNQQMAILWGGDFVAHMVQLTAKEPENGELDIGKVELTRGGVVTGKVTDRSTGEPVGGVRLRSIGGLDQQLEFMGAVTTISDKDGTYKLTGVPPKAHTIFALHPDYVSDFDPMQMMSGMRGGAGGGTPIFSGTALKAERDIELVPAASLTGQVLGPDGEPVAGAKVQQAQDQMAMLRMMFGGGIPAANTDGEGNFTLTGLKQEQSIQVFATHRDFGRSETATATAGERTTLTLTEPLRMVGIVVDEMGGPVSAVRITVERAQDGATNRGMGGPDMDTGAARPAITDVSGKFTVRNAPPGKLQVKYEHADYEIANASLDVAPGTSEHDLGKTTLKRGYGIEGVIVDEKDAPLPGVALNANWDYSAGDQATLPAPGTGRMNGQARSDEKGRFKIYGLRQGRFQLRTWQSGYFARTPTVETGTLDVRVVLETAAKLVGRVTANGLPVVNANVRAETVKADSANGRGTDQIGWGQTDTDGVFRMLTLPRDTPFRLTIQHDGFQTLQIDSVHATDEEQRYALQAGIRIAGIVVEAGGGPVPNVNIAVAVRGENSQQNSKNVRTGVDGRFEAGGLDAGEITVQIARWNSDYIAIDPIVVTPGDTSIRIVAEKGESIDGSILGADGAPLKQVNITAVDADDKQIGQTWVWEDAGSFHLGGLRKGRYTIKASRWVEGKMEMLAVATDVATGTKNLELRAAR